MSNWFWLIIAGCFGAMAGSYVNMASYRLPRNISTITRTRSFCPSCQAQLAWYENIPILSYLALLGRCRHCKASIGIRYLLVELFVTALFVAAAYQFFALNEGLARYYQSSRSGQTINFYWWRLVAVFIAQLFLIIDLTLLSVADLETWLIPTATTRAGIIAALILGLIFPELHASATNWTLNPYFNSLIDIFTGFVLGAGLLWAVGFIVIVITFFVPKLLGRQSRPKEGMGLGDVHLMGMIGALLGWKAALLTIFVSVFIGSFTGIVKILWEMFQQRRLGDKYRPWQPAFDLPSSANETDAQPETPCFWHLLVMGAVVLIASFLLYERSMLTFGAQMSLTWEETKIKESTLTTAIYQYDARLLPVAFMFFIGLLLAFASVFLKYLSRLDMLPQGDIVEQSSGEKQEIYQGHYVPFGPSLAIAALIVVFFDPLLRNFAFWFAYGATGDIAPPSYRVIGEASILSFITAVAKTFNQFIHNIIC